MPYAMYIMILSRTLPYIVPVSYYITNMSKNFSHSHTFSSTTERVIAKSSSNSKGNLVLIVSRKEEIHAHKVCWSFVGLGHVQDVQSNGGCKINFWHDFWIELFATFVCKQLRKHCEKIPLRFLVETGPMYCHSNE